MNLSCETAWQRTFCPSLNGVTLDQFDCNAFDFDQGTNSQLWRYLCDVIVQHPQEIRAYPVAPQLAPERLRSKIAEFDFAEPMEPVRALSLVVDFMRKNQVHPPHPHYFGLFNPAPTTMGIVADALVAAFNPNLANWSNSPFGCEVESHLIRAFAQKLGFDPAKADGTFTSGGAEANFSAVLTALTNAYPEIRTKGVRVLEKRPVLYCSSEGHHSFVKAAGMSGLGTDSVRFIQVNSRFQTDVSALAQQIKADRASGCSPFMVVATAGTTNAGAVDPIRQIHEICEHYGLWLHADAAWGGAVALVPALRRLLDGIEMADSITFDAHKWLSMPMGAGMFLTRHQGILQQTFDVHAAYMPTEADGFWVKDPYKRSIQWSRRFLGLPLFLSLLVSGWDGFEQMISRMIEVGDYLREKLRDAGWMILNDTELPLVCFAHPDCSEARMPMWLDRILREVLNSQKVWISKTVLGGKLPALRACVTNHRTSHSDVDDLVATLELARRRLSSGRTNGQKITRNAALEPQLKGN